MKTPFLLATVFMFTCGVCLAQPAGSFLSSNLPAVKSVEPRIFVGQPVAETQAVLKAQQIQSSDLAKPFPMLNAELSVLAFTIDLDNVGAYVFYNKTTQKVTGLTIVFKPFGDAEKSAESYVEAKTMNWYADRTYAIQFMAPTHPEFAKLNNASAPENKFPAVLFPGQAIAEAERTLEQQLKIDFGSGRRAIQKPPPDQAEYSFNFDETQVRGALFYSLTTSKVLSVLVSFRPSNPQLSDETDISVLSWNIHPDSTYSIRFAKPPTREEYEDLVRKRANVKNEVPTRP